MSKVNADISVSLDGYIAGPNDVPGNGLGDGGERLHEWVYGLEGWREPHGMSGGENNQDSEMMKEARAAVGALVRGGGMFDLAEEPWGDNPPFHADVFVVTHRPRETLVKEGGTRFLFVGGIEDAVSQAKTAAGEKDVAVSGGANIIQQLIKAGLIDELQLHVVPMFLGGGRPLFAEMGQIEFEPVRVVGSPKVTHLRYRLVK